jgi:hypothetical protein
MLRRQAPADSTFADNDRASVNPGEQTVERAPNREALPQSMHAIHVKVDGLRFDDVIAHLT